MKRVVEVFEDDLGGGAADVTVTFALEGVVYEIDLNNDNAARLREALRPFIAVARPVAQPKQIRRSAGIGSGESPAVVREWARAHGYQVNERGRIPASVVAAYKSAHAAA